MKVFLLSVGLSLVFLCSGAVFISTDNPLTVVMDSNKTITANFVRKVVLTGQASVIVSVPVNKLLTIPLMFRDANAAPCGDCVQNGSIFFGVDVNSIPATTVSFTQMSITRDVNDLIGKVSIKWTPAKKYIGMNTIRCFALDNSGNRVNITLFIKVN